MSGHEWRESRREGWSVCSRCGMVRNYERDTPCKGALPSIDTRIAELERAAETTRAEHAAALAALSEAYATNESLRTEHAAALGLATARIRELEGEREELLGLVWVGEAERDLCANALYERDHTAVPPMACSYSRDVKCWEHRRRAIVARIEKATT